MAKTQEVPAIIRPFNNVFERLAYRHNASEVFDDFLTYTVYVFTENRDEQDLEYIKRKYGEDYDIMPELFREFMLGMEKGTEQETWYDLLGIYYEIITSRWKSSNMGQFFTPMSVCNFMAEITGDSEPVKGRRVMDCACGSGRTLLAFNVRNYGNHFYANDLDPMATKMCIVNFLVHGVVGEVTCSNALDPSDYRWGYKVNHNLYPWSRVSCRRMTKDESTVHNYWDDVKEQNVQKTEQHTEPIAKPKKAPKQTPQEQQLTFF
jgi:type I restriction enzyme M protein